MARSLSKQALLKLKNLLKEAGADWDSEANQVSFIGMLVATKETWYRSIYLVHNIMSLLVWMSFAQNHAFKVVLKNFIIIVQTISQIWQINLHHYKSKLVQIETLKQTRFLL